MRATPNINFTVVEPTLKSLKTFVTMLRSVYQNLINVINGSIGFGDGTNADNVSGVWANVVAPVAPNTDFTVTHNLNRLPVGYWVMQKDRACDVYTGSVPATKTQLTLRATAASAVLRLFVIGLLLSMFATRSKAQNVAYHDIALVAVNTSAGLVARPISSAVITVCAGVHTEIPCFPATTIFSNAIGTTQLNPFNADINGNFSFFATPGNNFTVSITGVGVAGINYPFFAPLVSIGAIGNATFTSLTSASANPAASGVIRLAQSDTFGWRNVANSADLLLSISSANELVYNTGSGTGIIGGYFGTASTRSTTGVYRLANGERVSWRNGTNTADLDLELLPAAGNIPVDTLYFRGNNPGIGNGMELAFVAQDGTQVTLATGGFIRMHTGDTINWRNNANSTDVVLSKTGAVSGTIPADTLSWNSAMQAQSFGAFAANPSGTGLFRLGNTDSVGWRNAANNADCSIAKNGSDQFTFGCGGPIIPSANLPATTSNCAAGNFATGLNAGGTPICAAVGVAAKDDRITQAADVGPITLLTPAANGFYRFTCWEIVTQQATTSSTLPGCSVAFTDADSSTPITMAVSTSSSIANPAVGTTTRIMNVASNIYYGGFFAKSGNAITYSTTGYASVGGTPMQFAIHVRLEGPL